MQGFDDPTLMGPVNMAASVEPRVRVVPFQMRVSAQAAAVVHESVDDAFCSRVYMKVLAKVVELVEAVGESELGATVDLFHLLGRPMRASYSAWFSKVGRVIP